MAEKENKEKSIKIDLTEGPDPRPQAGDEVNYVTPHEKKVIKVKVVHVPEEHKGRTVMLEIPAKKKNADGEEVATLDKVSAPFRPKEKLAGHTWHHALIAALLLLVFSVRAGIPTYHTYSANGSAANPATLVFPADPNLQVRLINIWYIADTNNAALQVSSGTTAYSLLWTNLATTTVTNIVNSTNGLAAGGIVILQHAGVNYTNDVISVGNTGTNTMAAYGVAVTNLTTTYGAAGNGPVGTLATNVNWVVLQSGGWGVLPSLNDEFYLMGPVSSFPCNGTTNILQNVSGDDIFSGNYGRPVLLMLTPASKTNQIISASAHYDSASQP